MTSYTDSIKNLIRKYGKVAIGVHFSVYFMTLSGTQPLKNGAPTLIKCTFHLAYSCWLCDLQF